MVKKGLITGVVLLVLGIGINWLVGMLLPAIAQEYQNTLVFRPWQDPLMMVYFLYPFLLGVVLAYLWGLLHDKLPGKPEQKAWQFARTYFIIATVPGMFITFTSMQISLTMVLLWALTGFLQTLVAGFIFTRVK